MTKTITSLSIFLTLFSINTFAANSPPRQKAILKLDSYAAIFSIAFSPDSQSVASGGWPSHANLWDLTSEERKTTLTGHSGEVYSVVFSPDSSTLAVGGDDRKVRLWDMASGQTKTVLTGHSDTVRSVAFSPDGSTLVSGSWDSTVRLWDVASGQIKALLIGHTDRVYSVAFSPDGSTLVSGSWDSTVRLWDVASGQTRTVLTGHSERINSVAFSSDGNTIASGGGSTVHLWDVASEERKTTLTGHSDTIRSVAFSPDGSTLASGSLDRTVRLWDVASGQTKTILTGHSDRVYSVAFSPDGSTLASGIDWRGDNTIILWDLTASATTPAMLSISHTSTETLGIGEQLTVSLNIAGGENVRGYQATVVFDPDALIYFSSANGEYLSDGAFFAAPDVGKNYVTLASAALAGESNGDGVLATIIFQVVDAKASGLFLSQGYLVDPDGERLFPCIENGIAEDGTVEDSTVIEPVYIAEDINEDGVVNIQDLVLISSNFGKTGEDEADINGDGIVDIVDLVKVAAALGNTAGAPSVHLQTLAMLSTSDVQNWLTQAQHLNLTDVTSQRGIHFLEQLLAALTPQKTILLPNYPNPFNPETWIPYHLAAPAEVSLSIYDVKGVLVRKLTLGHQPAGVYQSKVRAAYWDGRNELGEPVASGVYFYTLSAGDFTATGKMLIRK